MKFRHWIAATLLVVGMITISVVGHALWPDRIETEKVSLSKQLGGN